MKTNDKLIYDKVVYELAKRNIQDKERIEEFTQSCLDEFTYNVEEKGLSKEEALKEAYASLEESLNEAYGKVVGSNKYKFSFVVSAISMVLSLVTLILGWLTHDIIYLFDDLYLIIFLIVLGIVVYTIVTRKKRSWFDFCVVGVICIAAIVINIEVLFYFYRSRTEDFYYTAYYQFPGIIPFYRNFIISQEPFLVRENRIATLFDPLPLVSFLLLLSFGVLMILEKKKHEK